MGKSSNMKQETLLGCTMTELILQLLTIDFTALIQNQHVLFWPTLDQYEFGILQGKGAPSPSN